MRAKLVLLFGFLLILFFPSQLGQHFWPSWSVINGLKIDYLSPTLLFTDILGLIFILLSRPKTSHFKFLILISIINLLFSKHFLITFFHWLRLYLYLYLFLGFQQFPHFKKYWLSALSLSVLWTSVLTILQFVSKSSLGGFWFWLGERPLSLAMPYVAKIYLPSLGYFLRPYATFPHPNALFGYLLIAGLIIYLNRLNLKNWKPLGYWSMGFGILAALLTFSKLIFLPLATIYPLSIIERILLIQNSSLIIQKHLLTGIGLGVYPAITLDYPSTSLQLSYQPVHNLFLLLLAELGLPLFLLIMYLIIKFCLRIINSKLIIVLFVILVTGSIDHYWLTSPSNLLLLTFTGALTFPFTIKTK